MAYWWDGNPNERHWVEIRKIPGIGRSLECPDHQSNSDGSHGRNTWYELVHSVRRGEIIYHYNEREQRFVGRSVAAADAEHLASDHAYVVDLEDFRPIAASIDLAYMRRRSATLFRLREELQAVHPDDTIYTPFQFRGSTLYGMMSNYFAKLPRDVVLELFGPDGLAESVLPLADDALQPPPDEGDGDGEFRVPRSARAEASTAAAPDAQEQHSPLEVDRSRIDAKERLRRCVDVPAEPHLLGRSGPTALWPKESSATAAPA